MGFMEIFGLTAMIFGIIFITGLSVNAVRKINKQKHTENKIRVRKQSMGLYYGWLVIATFNTLSMFMQMSTASEIGNSSREKAYLYIGTPLRSLLVINSLNLATIMPILTSFGIKFPS